MSRSLSSYRGLVLIGLAVLILLTVLIMALPAGAACPPASRVFAVEPGRPAVTLLKSTLLSGLTGYAVVSVAPPVHGTLEDQGDRYVYHPQPGFWTAGVDSFLLRLSPLNRGAKGTRVETVLLLAALQADGLCQQSFEMGSADWPVFGDNREIFGPENALSGTRSLRVYGFPGDSSGLTCEANSYGGNGNNGGGQQGSSASVTLRPPGGGAGGNLLPEPTPATPGQMLVLKLGAGSSAEHRVWMQDDGEHLAFRLESLTGTTAWLPVPRAAHRLQILQWPRSEDLSRRSGAALFVDGARVAELVPSAANEVIVPAPGLQAGALEIAGANPLYADLDDLAFQGLTMASAWSCKVADGFDDGVPDPAWTATGALAVTATAAIEGEGGLEVPLGSLSGSWLRASLPGQDHRLGVRFRFDPSSASVGGQVMLASAVTTGGTHAFALLLDGTPSGYHLTVVDNPYSATPRASAPIAIPNGPVEIALDWQRSASSNVGLGTLRLWLNGEPKATLTGLVNASLEIAEIRLGAIPLAGSSADPQGALHIDQFLVIRGQRP